MFLLYFPLFPSSYYCTSYISHYLPVPILYLLYFPISPCSYYCIPLQWSMSTTDPTSKAIGTMPRLANFFVEVTILQDHALGFPIEEATPAEPLWMRLHISLDTPNGNLLLHPQPLCNLKRHKFVLRLNTTNTRRDDVKWLEVWNLRVLSGT